MQQIASLYLRRTDVSSDYRYRLMRLAKKLDAAGITHETITVDRVNDFLTELPCSSRTRTNHRNHIRTLWRFAISVGMARSIERPLKIFKCKKTPVIAWTLGQLAQLDRAAAARTCVFRISKPLHPLIF